MPNAPRKPKTQYGTSRPKVPPFARYVGTSAWRKYRRRVREYANYLAKQAAHPAA